MVFAFDTRPMVRTDYADQRDFLTCEEELPAAVSFALDGPLDAATRLTDVKHETTDDN